MVFNHNNFSSSSTGRGHIVVHVSEGIRQIVRGNFTNEGCFRGSAWFGNTPIYLELKKNLELILCLMLKIIISFE